MTAQVHVITGPARCGKTQLLLDTYRHQLGDRRRTGLPQCCWLGPNQAAIARLKDGLLQTAEVSVLCPNLFTFAGFAESLIEQSRQKIRAISTVQKRRLLRRVIHSAHQRGELQHFAQVAETPGFVTQVDEAIAGLKRSDVWPEQFHKWCQNRPASDRSNREIAQIYLAYQQQLHQGDLYDTEGRFWAARSILAESIGEPVQHYELIVVNGFNDFTTAQYDILRLLAERCDRTLISLTNEPSQSSDSSGDSQRRLLFARTTHTLACLTEQFPQLQIESPKIRTAKPNTLQDLQRRVFRESSVKVGGGIFEGIEIVAAGSELVEIETVAQAIKQLLVTTSAQPEEIVVVHRGGDEAATRINVVFTDFGIPYQTESRPRLETQPLVRTLQTVLRLELEDWPFQALLEVVGNRLLTRLDSLEYSAQSFDTRTRVALESRIRAAQIPAGKNSLFQHLTYRLEHPHTDDSSVANKRTSQVYAALQGLGELKAILEALPERGPINSWLKAIEHLLIRLGVFESPTQRTPEAATWRCLRRGLREVEAADSWIGTEQLLTLADFQELLAAVATEQKVPSTRDGVGRVQVLSAESARKTPTKHLFLAGLSEQAFSASETQTTADDPANASALPELPGEAPLAMVSASDSKLLFYELVTRPTESLTLSYPSLDAKAQPLPPSPLIDELLRSVGPDRVTRRMLTPGQSTGDQPSPLSRGDFRRAAVRQALDGKPRWLTGMISDPRFVRAGSSVLGGVECVARRAQRDGFGEYEGLVHGEAARATLARRFDAAHLWSPSRLENYSACPFRFFAEQLLRLSPINELALSNDARRRGSLLHQVLATVHEELSRQRPEAPSSDTECDSEADDLVQRFMSALEAAIKSKPLSGIDRSLQEIERREIAAWAPSYAEQELNYRKLWNEFDVPPRPAHFEVRFGPETRGSSDDAADPASTEVPFELELGDERILLTGQIDRVDIGHVHGVTVLNIIDYKSGKEVQLSEDKVRSGHQLQLPLYALAAERLLLADRQAMTLATGYWSIRGKGFHAKKGGFLQVRELDGETLGASQQWRALQPDILSRVQEIIHGIRQGDFPVYNQDEQCTRGCELSTICRIGQIRSLEKTWIPSERDS